VSPDLTRAVWRKSTKSQDNGGCVEVADLEQHVAVRDAKNPEGPALVFSGEQWDAFIAGAAAGEFNRR
jgi:Domain of unknown function (DUF397)